MVKNMKQVNKMLEHVNKEMNAGELAKVMDQFEHVRCHTCLSRMLTIALSVQAFEDFDVKEKVMSDAINQATATSTPTQAVHDLLRQIADENNLDVRSQLDAIPTVQQSIATPAQKDAAAQSNRLAALRHAF